MASSTNQISSYADFIAPCIRAYELRLSKFGTDAKSVFWKNKSFQEKRFKILSKIFANINSQHTNYIHDFGCGYGAFYDFLKNSPIMVNGKFVGTDASKKMIDGAKARINHPRVKFVHGLIATETADYTIVSGTFNMKMEKSDLEWQNYVENSLKQLWSQTRKGLAFNMLRDDTEQRFKGLYYINGTDLKKFCSKNLSQDVILRNDTPLPDWTFYVTRSQNK